MNVLRMLKLYGQVKDVRKAYEEEKGKKSPVFYSRKIVGPILAVIASVILYKTGIAIDENILKQLSEHIEVVISAIVGIYGIIMVLVSLFKGEKESRVIR